jgi:iron complex outermembrane receptor protein
MHPSRAALLAALATPAVAWAQAPKEAPQQMPGITVTAPAAGPEVAPVSPAIERYSPPNTIVSTDRRRIEDTVNIVDTEDAVKYFPSLFVRKRNYGDNQPVLATRTWGVNSSARTLIYADDILLSALIGNNNSNAAPRWGLVSPEEIKGIDMMYGPFSAAYPGNSIGGVMLITTRMPETFEATLKQTNAFQNFSWYATTDTYTTTNTAGTLGARVGNVSFFLAANREESFSQPLGFVTNGSSFAAGTYGTIKDVNKTGNATNVVGASGLLHSIMDNYKLKWAVDLNDWLKFSHTIGYWQNSTYSTVQSYLRQNGLQTFGGVNAFANGNYRQTEQHLANAVSLRSDTRGTFDFEMVGTWYTYLTSTQRGPSGVGSGLQFTTGGTNARMDGTGWWTADAKGIWRPSGPGGAHEVSFGVHGDQYILNNPTYQMSNWLTSPDQGNGTVSSFGAGKTETWGLWAQDKWNFAPGWTATLGGRVEMWRAYDGYNITGSTAVAQPPVQAGNFSPKASVAWQIDPEWSTRLNYGQAVRYPTVNELYQIVTVGLVNVVPNPGLKPETAQSFEWSIERKDRRTALRLSLFEENTANALIQQTSTVNGILTNNWQNVGLIRNRGVEFAGEARDVGIRGLDLGGSVTYVDSKILSNAAFGSSFGSTSVGMWAPYVPQWRGTAVATYKPDGKWSFTAAARWQGWMYSTLDNSDYVHNVYGSFDPFFVVDLKARYRFMERAAIEVGVDNVGDYKYFLFHPFPQRTFIASLKATF